MVASNRVCPVAPVVYLNDRYPTRVQSSLSQRRRPVQERNRTGRHIAAECGTTVAVNVTLCPFVICAAETVSVAVVATVLCVTTTLAVLEIELLSSLFPK